MKNKIIYILSLMILSLTTFAAANNNSVVTIAKIEGSNAVVHSSDAGGKITNVYYQNGDFVKKGTVIMTVQNDQVSTYMKQMEHQYLMTKANYDKTQKFSKDQQLLNLEKAKKSLVTSKMNLQKAQNGTKVEQIDQLKYNVETSKSNYDTLKKNYEKNKVLYTNKSISEQAYLQIKTQYESAENSYKSSKKAFTLAEKGADIEDINSLKAAVNEAQTTYNITQNMINQQIWNYDINAAAASMNSAQEAYKLAKKKNGELGVIAEVSGIISGLDIEVGNKVTSGKSLFSVSNIGTMQLKASLEEKNIGSIAKNSTVDIYVPTLKKHFTGTIDNISPVANPKTKKFEVKIKVNNNSQTLREGMFAQVSIKKVR